MANRVLQRKVAQALPGLKARLGDNVLVCGGRCRGLALNQEQCGRPMATSAVRTVPQSHEDSANGVQRRESNRGFTSPFGLLELWDPFFPTRNLRQMVDTMDHLAADSVYPSRTGNVRGRRTPWDVLEDGEGFHLRVDLPGLAKEEVKVSVEDKALLIKAEHAETEGKWKSRAGTRSFSSRLELPDNADLGNIKAELKNGVLEVTVPKLKAEQKVIKEVPVS